MWVIGPIGFAVPWVLLGLLGLPLLWLLLKAVPPAPLKRRFPGVALLLGLKDEDAEADKTPLWLLLLRMVAIAAVIVAMAVPVLNPRTEEASDGPLLILMDASWASAPDWALRTSQVAAQIDSAQANDRSLCVLVATAQNSAGCQFASPPEWRSRMAGIAPAAWSPDYASLLPILNELPENLETFWVSDRLDHEGREEVAQALATLGSVNVFEADGTVLGLRNMSPTDGGLSVDVLRSAASVAQTVSVDAIGPDPAGQIRVLETQIVELGAGENIATATLEMPAEIRNRLTRFQIAESRGAGVTLLTDDSVKRLEIGLVTTGDDDGLQLLSQHHYIRAATAQKFDVIEGALTDLIVANPDILVLTDIAQLSGAEAAPLIDWVNEGGLLIRFSGPKMAASDVARESEDPLLPVRLRAGGRTVGGAMSWGEPKSLRAFSETSPFYGLDVPDDVVVSAQILAQPDPELSERTIAALQDGTPLVTRKNIGQGQVVLFHVTAHAEWSSLPLSVLFVDMFDRLSLAAGQVNTAPSELAGLFFQLEKELTGDGVLIDPRPVAPLDGGAFENTPVGGAAPAGLYRSGELKLARNVLANDAELRPATWPNNVTFVGASQRNETSLAPYFMLLLCLCLVLDMIASMALSGRLRGARVVSALLVCAMMGGLPEHAMAQSQLQESEIDDQFATAVSQAVTFAYVETQDEEVDRLSRAGLEGLRRIMFQRTSVEPGPTVGIDLETDDLGFFPILYWPITEAQPQPSANAYAKINTYLRTGGVILFDTRDSDVSDLGATTRNGQKLQSLARALDAPPLEIVPEDHVLTRAFYLLRDFPGRHQTARLWVEAPSQATEVVEGMPFRNLNDNVSPIIIGGGDWAAAWAVDERGAPLVPVGRGFAGERQREIAARFGVNLVMYVLTGSYKSDQVHVPALLERLGQ